jgi:hypothetical protein
MWRRFPNLLYRRFPNRQGVDTFGVSAGLDPRYHLPCELTRLQCAHAQGTNIDAAQGPSEYPAPLLAGRPLIHVAAWFGAA